MRKSIKTLIMNALLPITVSLLYLLFYIASLYDNADVYQFLADPELFNRYICFCLDYLQQYFSIGNE